MPMSIREKIHKLPETLIQRALGSSPSVPPPFSLISRDKRRFRDCRLPPGIDSWEFIGNHQESRTSARGRERHRVRFLTGMSGIQFGGGACLTPAATPRV